ncbi:sigma-70 RNA polymerase sigma factor region 4 domain-containing protein [Actinacidiphila yeochonensis]|uniref:sigma-70 family RNA polymerase sigma factor n=1 Tax=Actinacidiphila yeochonensis TaxID=89050 RepID=UPI00055B637F|nr:sigma-70 family RNA polymerase sigma factor [Actinacidiphila yeochonensis]
MYHPRQAHRPAVARPQSALRSPLAELEQAFLALAHGVEPLTFPAHLVCDEPDRAVWPVDRVRTNLAHPSTRAELREQTWREVVRRSRDLGEPWGVVAVAMTVPVLRRMLARLARPVHLERAEVEQEALAAVATALSTVDPGAQRLDRELFSAADRAVHRLAYAARRCATRETGQTAVLLDQLCAPSQEDSDEPVDELTVLARAVQAHALDVAEARLIARTRLEGEPMSRLASERGVSVRQLYRHRTAAEQHLAAHLCARSADK